MSDDLSYLPAPDRLAARLSAHVSDSYDVIDVVGAQGCDPVLDLTYTVLRFLADPAHRADATTTLASPRPDLFYPWRPVEVGTPVRHVDGRTGVAVETACVDIPVRWDGAGTVERVGLDNLDYTSITPTPAA